MFIVYWSDPEDEFATFTGLPAFFASEEEAVADRNVRNAAMKPDRQKWVAAQVVPVGKEGR